MIALFFFHYRFKWFEIMLIQRVLSGLHITEQFSHKKYIVLCYTGIPGDII